MADVFDFPFRLDPSGQIAAIEQDSDRDIENLIAVACYTRPWERVQAPTFGIADPAFVGWEQPALERHILDFGPAVEVTAVSIDRLGGDGRGDREQVHVTWHRRVEP